MPVPKISIIVPIYNVEKELDRCVKSLMNQSLSDVEIILVDDGSPDKCPQMCDDYAMKDSRILAIHKNNGGLSSARNAGLKCANGKYVLFVDSDDYIKRNACEVLYKKAEESDADIIVADSIKVENDQEFPKYHSKKSSSSILRGTEFLKEQLSLNTMSMAACFNLYRTSLLINNELFFKNGILHEDEQWTPRVFLKADKVRYIKFPFYYHVSRDDSITRSKNKLKNGIDLISTCYELEKVYEKIEEPNLKKLLNDYLVMLFLNAVQIGDLYDKKYSKIYSLNFLNGKPLTIKNKMKSIIFKYNRKLYKELNSAQKFLGKKIKL